MKTLFKIGDRAPISGWYICVPCGYVQRFAQDELFVTCEACFAGTSDGPIGYTDEGSEFWELLEELA